MEVWIFPRCLEEKFPQTPKDSKAVAESSTISQVSISLRGFYAFLNRCPCNTVFKQGKAILEFWQVWMILKHTEGCKDCFSINTQLLWTEDSWVPNSLQNKLLLQVTCYTLIFKSLSATQGVCVANVKQFQLQIPFGLFPIKVGTRSNFGYSNSAYLYWGFFSFILIVLYVDNAIFYM